MGSRVWMLDSELVLTLFRQYLDRRGLVMADDPLPPDAHATSGVLCVLVESADWPPDDITTFVPGVRVRNQTDG